MGYAHTRCKSTVSSAQLWTAQVQSAALVPPAERSTHLPQVLPRSQGSRRLPEAAVRGGAAARRRHLVALVQIYRRRYDGPLLAAAFPQSSRRAEAGVPELRRRLPAPSEGRPSRHGARRSCKREASGQLPRPLGATLYRLTHAASLPGHAAVGLELPAPTTEKKASPPLALACYTEKPWSQSSIEP